MSVEISSDPRTTIVRDKCFSLRPRSLERWLWAAKAPSSAERVYWYHWDIGHQAGTWLSQVPIRVVARDCGLDGATVTRAYQWLKARGLLHRLDAGRDDSNPFRQATAITEVFLPRELVARLAAEPNRRRPGSRRDPQPTTPATPEIAQLSSGAPEVSRQESRAIFQKLSEGERARFYSAQRARCAELSFDADSRLTAPEQLHVVGTLKLLAGARPTAREPTAIPSRGQPAQRTRMSAADVLMLNRRLAQAKGEGDSRCITTLVREVAWSVERGSLARFQREHALAIACKKVREGAWRTPFGMPLGWHPLGAAPEVCSAAGGI